MSLIRWARASATPGDFCRDETHAPSDYLFGEPRYVDHPDSKVVNKMACGVCWLAADNPGVSLVRREEKGPTHDQPALDLEWPA